MRKTNSGWLLCSCGPDFTPQVKVCPCDYFLSLTYLRVPGGIMTKQC